MPGSAYMNIDLMFERKGAEYSVRVINSPAGQAKVDFKIPFSKLEFDNFLLRMGRPRGNVRRESVPEMEAGKTLGGKLFGAVFHDELSGCLRSSLDEADREGVGLRIRLRFADTPELADLPWEYLYNERLNRFLCLSNETPIVRYLDLPERIPPIGIKPPLRVLVMISSPHDFPELNVEREWKILKQSLESLERRGTVVLERLETATLSALQKKLRRGSYHIFHFIGHGGFDKQAQDGMLILEDGQERGRAVYGEDLGMIMHDHRPLRMVILNACEGARAARNDPFAGTAQSLVQQGIAAVVAMQFEITDDAAISFAQDFYSAIADGHPLDAAVTEARKAIYAQGLHMEWGTPVLYMRSPDGKIFEMEDIAEGEAVQRQYSGPYEKLFTTAESYKKNKEYDQAIATYNEILKDVPNNKEALIGLRLAEKALYEQTQIADFIAKGKIHQEAEEYEEALIAFDRALEFDPTNQEVREFLSQCKRQQEEWQERKRRRRKTVSKVLWTSPVVAAIITGAINWFITRMPDSGDKTHKTQPPIERKSIDGESKEVKGDSKAKVKTDRTKDSPDEAGPGKRVGEPSVKQESDKTATKNSSETAQKKDGKEGQVTKEQLRKYTEAARVEMVTTRNAVSGTYPDKRANSNYGRGEELERKGVGQLNAGDLVGARASFVRATALYAEAGQEILAGGVQAAWEKMKRTRDTIPAIGRDREGNPKYVEGERLEALAKNQWNAGNLTEAQSSSTKANSLYAAVAQDAKKRIQEFQNQFQSTLDGFIDTFENENLDRLTNIYQEDRSGWASLFESANNIKVTIVDRSTSFGDRRNATAHVRFKLEYNNRGVKTTTPAITRTWILEERGGEWIITARKME